jgi:hypothetical protein
MARYESIDLLNGSPPLVGFEQSHDAFQIVENIFATAEFKFCFAAAQTLLIRI